MFVFGNYEGFRERLGQSSRGIYPDVSSRQGLLPCYLAYPTSTAANCPNRAALVTVPNLKPGMLPYANLWWPVPNGPEVLSPEGLPTGTAYNYNDAVRKVYEHFVMTRVDYVFSAKNTLFGNYTFSDGQRDAPQLDSYYTQYVPQRSQTFGMTETHVFSPTVVNSATLGWVRPIAGMVTTNGRGPAIPKNLIFLEGGNPGSIVIGGGATTTAPSSVTPGPGNNPLKGNNEYYSLADDLRFTKGKHSYSAGVGYSGYMKTRMGQLSFQPVARAIRPWRDSFRMTRPIRSP